MKVLFDIQTKIFNSEITIEMKSIINYLSLTLLVLTCLLLQNSNSIAQAVNLPACLDCPSGNTGASGGVAACTGSAVFPYYISDFDISGDYTVILTQGGQVFDYKGHADYGVPSKAFTPVRMDVPGGVTAIDVAINDNHVYVVGSNGKLYGYGINGNGGPDENSAGYNAQSMVELDIPAGINVTQVESTGSESASGSSDQYWTIIITDTGQAYYKGNQLSGLNFEPHVPDWSPITLPGAGITYNKAWIIAGDDNHVDPGISEYAVFAFFEGSDGKYYSFGYGGFWNWTNAWGNSSFQPAYDGSYYNNYTYTSASVYFEQSPIEMNFPAGTVIDHIDLNPYRYAYFAYTDVGKTYTWGVPNIEGYYVEPGATVTGDFYLDPVEVLFPDGNQTHTPAEFQTVHLVGAITDVGTFFPNSPQLVSAGGEVFNDEYFATQISDDWFFRSMPCGIMGKRIESHFLSDGGILYKMPVCCPSADNNFLPVRDGRYDSTNPRPEEN